MNRTKTFRGKFLLEKKQEDIKNIRTAFGLKPSTIEEVSKNTGADLSLVKSVVDTMIMDREIDLMFKSGGRKYYLKRFFSTKKSQKLFMR